MRTMILLLVFASASLAGEPTNATVGYLSKIKLEKMGDDPKIVCSPENNDWLTNVDFDGNKAIIFVPGKRILGKDEKSKVFTFIVASNQDKKTILSTYTVIVKPDEESPSPTDELNSDDPIYKAYMVSPSATGKVNLINVLTQFLNDLKADKFTSNLQAAASLKAVADKIMEDDLKKVREVITTELVAAQVLPFKKEPLVASIEKNISKLKRLK